MNSEPASRRNEEGVALAIGTLGIAAASQKRYEEGIALLGEAAALHTRLGYEWESAAVSVMLAGAWLGLGDLDRARETAEEGLALARKVGDRTAISVALHVLAMVAHASGDQERAKGLFGEGLALAAELGDEANVVYYLEELGAVCASEGKPGRAARLWGPRKHCSRRSRPQCIPTGPTARSTSNGWQPLKPTTSTRSRGRWPGPKVGP